MWHELPEDIREELEHPDYITRKHYSRATYALGCHGPLCRKAERDRGRARNEERGGEDYSPALDIRVSDPENIDEIIAWHVNDLNERRSAARAAV